MKKQITIKNKEELIFQTKGEEQDVLNWIEVFKTIAVTKMDDEVIIRVTDNEEEYKRSKIVRSAA